MRVSALRTIALIGIALSSLSLAGCAGRGGMKKGQDSNRYVARDVDTLYNAARDALDKKQYRMAAALFDEVERQHPYSVWARRSELMSAFAYYLRTERQHPYSVWARRSELMSAFAYYLAHNYPESIQSSQRFLSIHPGNKDAPYALYLIAVDYYEQISDVTRDQKITGQALDAMGELIRRYPDSKYAADARLKVDLINDHLAGKEMEIGRFYQRRGEWLASVIRFRTVIDKFQSSSHTPEALMRLTEGYIALGVVDEAKKAAAVLGANYPGTDYYKHAYELIQKRERKG